MSDDSNYKSAIRSMAVAIIKSGNKDDDLDTQIKNCPYLKDKDSYLEILQYSDNPNAIFELGVLPLLVEQNALKDMVDFYHYASYYAIHQDLNKQIELLEIEIAKN